MPEMIPTTVKEPRRLQPEQFSARDMAELRAECRALEAEPGLIGAVAQRIGKIAEQMEALRRDVRAARE